MTAPVDPAIVRFSRGEISALRAAALLGDHVSVSEVIVMTKLAGLEPPRQTPEHEAAELAHARRVLGMA